MSGCEIVTPILLEVKKASAHPKKTDRLLVAVQVRQTLIHW
jgi:hypothetical protein